MNSEEKLKIDGDLRAENTGLTETDNEAKRTQTEKDTDSKASFIHLLYDIASILASAFVLLMVVFAFFFRVVGVRGYSMEDTLHQNDWLITTQKEAYTYGDIIVITQPNYFNEPLIKRVIATGGQTVNIDYEKSAVYVDGVELDELYRKEDTMYSGYSEILFPYTVPEGFLFVMGDNRNNSTDSRSSLVGPIDERYVLGKASLRIMNTGENFKFGDFNIYDYER